MLLAIDVGNTNSAIGVYRGDTLVGNWRVSTTRERTSDESGMLLISILQYAGISPAEIDAAIICSVVPPAVYSIINAIKKYLGINRMLVEHGVKRVIHIK